MQLSISPLVAVALLLCGAAGCDRRDATPRGSTYDAYRADQARCERTAEYRRAKFGRHWLVTTDDHIALCGEQNGALFHGTQFSDEAVCYRPFPDGGEHCTDSDQCSGYCLLPVDFSIDASPGAREQFLSAGETASGLCQNYSYNQDMQRIEDGLTCLPDLMD